MLRASSLGLTFTYAISRFSLLQRHRFLHKQLGHEAVLLVNGVPRSHSTTKARLAKKARTPETEGRRPCGRQIAAAEKTLSVPALFRTPR